MNTWNILLRTRCMRESCMRHRQKGVDVHRRLIISIRASGEEHKNCENRNFHDTLSTASVQGLTVVGAEDGFFFNAMKQYDWLSVHHINTRRIHQFGYRHVVNQFLSSIKSTSFRSAFLAQTVSWWTTGSHSKCFSGWCKHIDKAPGHLCCRWLC